MGILSLNQIVVDGDKTKNSGSGYGEKKTRKIPQNKPRRRYKQRFCK